jgi:branched-chain amino acid transport system substrate-binding protein
MLVRRIAVIAVLAVAMAAAAGCGSSSESSSPPSATASAGGAQTLKVGVSSARSGPFAAYDVPVVNGVKYAVDEINRQGGVDGVKIQLVLKDNQGEPSLGVSNVQDMLDEGVRAFVLPTTNLIRAQAQLVSQAGGVMLFGSNTSPQLVADVGPNGFLAVYGDNAQAAASAKYACEQNYRSAYTLTSSDDPYFENLPRYFEDAFAHDCGGRVVGTTSFKYGQTEFGAQVTKIANADPKPDVIYSPMLVPDSGVFLKALRQNGVTTPFLGADGNDSPLFATSGGDAVDGAVYTSHGFPTAGSPFAKFIDDFTKATGKKPESNVYEAIGRDNVYLLAAAAAAAHSTDPAKLITALGSLQGVPLLTGDTTYSGGDRVPKKPVFLIRMDGKRRALAEQLTPTYVPAG